MFDNLPRAKRDNARGVRRYEAELRQAERAKRTNGEQLALIRERRGESLKERARLEGFERQSGRASAEYRYSETSPKEG